MTSIMVFLACVALGTAALADIAPPPGEESCDGKEAGDSCRKDGDRGECMESTCTRYDVDEDGNPVEVPYSCLECVPDDSGCSTAGPLSDSGALPWAVVLLVPGLIYLVCRRRQS